MVHKFYSEPDSISSLLNWRRRGLSAMLLSFNIKEKLFKAFQLFPNFFLFYSVLYIHNSSNVKLHLIHCRHFLRYIVFQ